MKAIPVVATKGGVGKSLVTIITAYAIKELGFKAALLDCDVSMPAVVRYLNIENNEPITSKEWIEPLNVDNVQIMSPGLLMDKDQPVLMNANKRVSIIQQFLDKVHWNADYLIIDTPPGSNDEMEYLLRNRRKLLSGVFVVTTPSDVAITQVRRSIILLQRAKIPILGIIGNMVNMECQYCHKVNNVFTNGGVSPIETLADEFKLELIAELPVYPAIDAKPLHFVPKMMEGLKYVVKK